MSGAIIAEKCSVFHKILIFFMRLAWRSRITLPYLIMIGFMMVDIRLTLEIFNVPEQHPHGNGSSDEESDSDSEMESDSYQIEP